MFLTDLQIVYVYDSIHFLILAEIYARDNDQKIQLRQYGIDGPSFARFVSNAGSQIRTVFEKRTHGGCRGIMQGSFNLCQKSI